MQIRSTEIKEGGVPCGCGRSPTGFCIGWHGLSEEMFNHQKMLWLEEELKKSQEKHD